VKVLVAPKAVEAAVVAVINVIYKHLDREGFCQRLQRALLGVCLLASSAIQAAVLPEDRADIMFHSYDGGGVTIDGPSLLVRKDFASTVSVSANYYVDNVSSASIDVEASGASRYTEQRNEYSVSADYLYDKAIISAGFTNSEEDDYEANTFYVGISQDFFGDLSTFTMSYAQGDDTVMQNGNDNLEEAVDRQNFRFGLSQIATANLILTLNYETVTDEGYLNNPYRSYRFADPNNAGSYVTETEVYPRTRTSDAVAFGGRYFLPYRAAVHGNYRYFTDDWEIESHTYSLGYTHPFKQHWIFDVSYRYYEQTGAYFYSDLHGFQSVDEKDFRARDKELSDFSSQTLGLGVSYEFQIGSSQIFDKSSLNLQLDYIEFDYQNFRDLRVNGVNPGEEPLYNFDATVIRLFLSVWY
jgi:hypothetical protein